jgi:hypothetical protein
LRSRNTPTSAIQNSSNKLLGMLTRHGGRRKSCIGVSRCTRHRNANAERGAVFRAISGAASLRRPPRNIPRPDRLVHAVVAMPARRAFRREVPWLESRRLRHQLQLAGLFQKERLHAGMRDRLPDCQHAARLQDDSLRIAERVGHPFAQH